MIGFVITRRDFPTLEDSKKCIGDIVVYQTEARAKSWFAMALTKEQQAQRCIEPVRVTMIREER